MKKVFITILTLLMLLTLSGCDDGLRHEYFNNQDQTDFSMGDAVKFDIIQLKNVIDEKTLKESNLNGGYFLFMGSISASSSEKTVVTNMYYGYLKNQNGGIYFAQIPANKVRIYEDSDTPVFVAYKHGSYNINNNNENNWDYYDNFNLHVPKGTIIPRVNLDLNLLK
jgi:hypothetical protein